MPRLRCRHLAAKVGRRAGCGSRRSSTAARPRRPGFNAATLSVAVAGTPIATSTEIQAFMVEDTIGRRLEITVWRNGALVDVIALPRELADR